MVRAYLKEYGAIAKAGLFHSSHRIMIGTALFMFMVGKYLGMELEILIFILTPIGYMLDFDAHKYVMNYIMPISMKRRLHLLYIVTIIGSFISVMMVQLRYYLEGSKRSMILCLFIFLVNIMGSNLYYYLFCSQEFKKDVLDEDKKQLIYQCIVGGLIGISVAGRLTRKTRSLIEYLIMSLNGIVGSILIGGMLIFTLWWTKKSMKTLEKTVRGSRR